jgi:hypothetical protein
MFPTRTSEGLRFPRRCHRQKCVATSTLPPTRASTRSPRIHLEPFLRRFKCRHTKFNARGPLHPRPAALTLEQRHLRLDRPMATNRLGQTARPLSRHACVNARCERTPTSSALPSWRWRCASGASWTISSQAGHDGRSHQGKRQASHTKLASTVFPSAGSQSVTRGQQRLTPRFCRVETMYWASAGPTASSSSKEEAPTCGFSRHARGASELGKLLQLPFGPFARVLCR